MSEHNKLGQNGEEEAVAFLQKQQYRILFRNWRYKHKEIDILALDGETLVVVEVKTRRAGGQQSPEEAITLSKMRYLVEATQAYIDKYDVDREVRFDVIGVIEAEKQYQVHHTRDAFNAMEAS